MTPVGDGLLRHEQRALERNWGELGERGDLEEIRKAVTADMLADAVASMKDGLQRRNRWGQPNSKVLNLFWKICGMAGVQQNVSVLIVNELGVSVEQAKQAVSVVADLEQMPEGERIATCERYLLGVYERDVQAAQASPFHSVLASHRAQVYTDSHEQDGQDAQAGGHGNGNGVA